MSSVFVSYAHVDNRPFSGEEKGWISHCVQHLRNVLDRRMGRAENYRLLMDIKLKGNDSLTPELEKQVKEAETLVLFLSTGWLASDWCRKELALFTEEARKRQAGRIFVVKLERLAELTQRQAGGLQSRTDQLLIRTAEHQLGECWPGIGG